MATNLGHLDQERKNVQSTKDAVIYEDFFPSQIPLKTQNCFFLICQLDAKEVAYTDRTGRFPYQSGQGNNYFMICYDFDANAILQQLLKNRETDSLIIAWELLHKRLTKHGHSVKKYILDNECSTKFKGVLLEHKLEFELVPPHQHRRNAAERAIRTFKNHFLAGLATCDPEFPLRQWDRLVEQAELTLNLLRNSRVNPKLSAWAYLFGNHDFNKVPLAPPGTRVVLHSKPEQRKSWAFHGEKGYYIGPAPEHYRCVRCFIPKTQKERITDTVAFIPKVIPIPHASIDDHLRKTVDDLVHLLTKKPGIISPTGPQSAQSALIKISKLLNSDTSPVIAPLQLPQESSQQSNTITDNTTHKTAKQSTTLPMDIQKINTPPSEGESHLHRSEGENALIGDRIKSSITPMPTATIPKHPSLYPAVPISQQQPSRFTKVLPTLQPKRRIQRVENQKIKQLLQEYKNVPKKTTRLRSPKPDKMHRRHVHRSPLTYIPIPKKLSHQDLAHHIQCYYVNGIYTIRYLLTSTEQRSIFLRNMFPN